MSKKVTSVSQLTSIENLKIDLDENTFTGEKFIELHVRYAGINDKLLVKAHSNLDTDQALEKIKEIRREDPGSVIQAWYVQREQLNISSTVQDLRINGHEVQLWIEKLPAHARGTILELLNRKSLPHSGPVNKILRWYRRCVLISEYHRGIIDNPYVRGGDDFIGSSYNRMDGDDNSWEEDIDNLVVGLFLDKLSTNKSEGFIKNLTDGIEMLGLCHPDQRIKTWWDGLFTKITLLKLLTKYS